MYNKRNSAFYMDDDNDGWEMPGHDSKPRPNYNGLKPFSSHNYCIGCEHAEYGFPQCQYCTGQYWIPEQRR